MSYSTLLRVPFSLRFKRLHLFIQPICFILVIYPHIHRPYLLVSFLVIT